MAEFLIEVYAPQHEPSAAVRARIAAEEMTREGTPVRYLRSIFVPEDETCFYLNEARSAEAVRAAAARAELRSDHLAEAVTEPRGADDELE